MSTEKTLETPGKAVRRARKVGLPSVSDPAPTAPVIPLPRDAQAYGAYLSFLALVARSTSSKPGALDEIDPNETALLEIVILRWAKGAPMTVRQTIAMAHLGSPATLHKRLMRLRAGNFLQLQDVAGDRRVKQLVAGPRGIEYIEAMGRHLLKAKRSPSGRPGSAETP
jgi:hypothetical protein